MATPQVTVTLAQATLAANVGHGSLECGLVARKTCKTANGQITVTPYTESGHIAYYVVRDTKHDMTYTRSLLPMLLHIIGTRYPGAMSGTWFYSDGADTSDYVMRAISGETATITKQEDDAFGAFLARLDRATNARAMNEAAS